MSKNKNKYTPKLYESNPTFLPKRASGRNATDTSANVYQSMIMSQAWHNLTGKQKELYYVCKAQYYGEKKTDELLTAKERFDGTTPNLERRFTMNKSKWHDIYGLYSSATQRCFYSDMQALIDNGFVKELENGEKCGTKSVYEYSNDWIKLGPWKRPPGW